MLDEEKSGSISLSTLRSIVKEFGEGIDDSELQEMIEKADGNGDGLVT
jgi:Ca2+-binding EF-hand superfamily protein